MGISSLVLTLAPDRAARDALVAALAAEPRVTLGAPVTFDGAERLPLVVESLADDDHADHGHLLEAIARDPGAALVTLVFHHYDRHYDPHYDPHHPPAAPRATEEPRA